MSHFNVQWQVGDVLVMAEILEAHRCNGKEGENDVVGKLMRKGFVFRWF